MKQIVITSGDLILEGTLNDTPTAETVYKTLPIEGKANRWGDEIYFEIPCDIGLEDDAREIVEPGDLGYWPTGKAFCIFFGRTPVSTDARPRAYSPVNVFGRIRGDIGVLRNVAQGDKVMVRRDEFALGG